MKTLDVRTAAEWRAWLADHHESESEVWLIFHKRHTGVASIPYGSTVDEALCFGWIDSLVKRLDDARYARKFTPRKPDSVWSDANRRRWARLKANGRLAPAGANRRPTGKRPEVSKARSLTTPAYIRKALRANREAATHFENLAPSHRRMYIGWIDSAKRQETKLRRLQQAIGLLAAGKKLGLK
jgi:uncharacterized protein YdeI (YjbR/CyaY-like superfamily)